MSHQLLQRLPFTTTIQEQLTSLSYPSLLISSVESLTHSKRRKYSRSENQSLGMAMNANKAARSTRQYFRKCQLLCLSQSIYVIPGLFTVVFSS